MGAGKEQNNSEQLSFEELWNNHYEKIMSEEPEIVTREFKKFLKAIYDGEKPKIPREKIKLPGEEKIHNYEELNNKDREVGLENINKVAFIKLNGGMATTMGLRVPKMLLTAKKGKNYFEIITTQLRTANKEYTKITGEKIEIPLILMNSFFTEPLTRKTVEDYELRRTEHSPDIILFNQHRHPRVRTKDLKPQMINGEVNWAAPGHGDFYKAIIATGVLDQLLKEGYEYAMVSNIDNLLATIDEKIVGRMIREDIDFLLEVADKTILDIKGGTPVIVDNKLRLLERAIVPEDLMKEFEDITYFKLFNTNNLWLNLKKLKEEYQKGSFKLPFIQNQKIINNEEIIQVETVIGDGISAFKKSALLRVPRSRFGPTKRVEDQLCLSSDLFIIDELTGRVTYNPQRTIKEMPKPIFDTKEQLRTIDDLKRVFEDPEQVSLINARKIVMKGKGRIIIKKGTIFKGEVELINNNPEEELIISGEVEGRIRK